MPRLQPGEALEETRWQFADAAKRHKPTPPAAAGASLDSLSLVREGDKGEPGKTKEGTRRRFTYRSVQDLFCSLFLLDGPMICL